MLKTDYDYFLSLDLTEYSDAWIAIVDNNVVSHGKNVKDVFKRAKKLHPKKRPLIAKVPGKQAMIL